MPRTLNALLALSLLVALASPAQALPAFEEVKRGFRPSDIQVLDRDGELLQRVRTDARARRGRWTPLV